MSNPLGGLSNLLSTGAQLPLPEATRFTNLPDAATFEKALAQAEKQAERLAQDALFMASEGSENPVEGELLPASTNAPSVSSVTTLASETRVVQSAFHLSIHAESLEAGMRQVTALLGGLSTLSVEEGAALVTSLTAGEVSREDAVGFVQTLKAVVSGLNQGDLAAIQAGQLQAQWLSRLQQDDAMATTLAQAFTGATPTAAQSSSNPWSGFEITGFSYAQTDVDLFSATSVATVSRPLDGSALPAGNRLSIPSDWRIATSANVLAPADGTSSNLSALVELLSTSNAGKVLLTQAVVYEFSLKVQSQAGSWSAEGKALPPMTQTVAVSTETVMAAIGELQAKEVAVPLTQDLTAKTPVLLPAATTFSDVPLTEAGGEVPVIQTSLVKLTTPTIPPGVDPITTPSLTDVNGAPVSTPMLRVTTTVESIPQAPGTQMEPLVPVVGSNLPLSNDKVPVTPVLVGQNLTPADAVRGMGTTSGQSQVVMPTDRLPEVSAAPQTVLTPLPVEVGPQVAPMTEAVAKVPQPVVSEKTLPPTVVPVASEGESSTPTLMAPSPSSQVKVEPRVPQDKALTGQTVLAGQVVVSSRVAEADKNAPKPMALQEAPVASVTEEKVSEVRTALANAVQAVDAKPSAQPSRVPADVTFIPAASTESLLSEAKTTEWKIVVKEPQEVKSAQWMVATTSGLEVQPTSFAQKAEEASARATNIIQQITHQVTVENVRAHTVSRLSFQLVPENLGKVTIQVGLVDQTVTAKLVVASPEVREVLQNHLVELKTSLYQAGLQIDQLQVQVQGGGAGLLSQYFQYQQEGYGTGSSTAANPNVKRETGADGLETASPVGSWKVVNLLV